jgi:hypothetical protein
MITTINLVITYAYPPAVTGSSVYHEEPSDPQVILWIVNGEVSLIMQPKIVMR